jgi:biopolymer transport protein ExbB
VRRRCLLLLVLLAGLPAGEADLVAGAQAARVQAESQLAEARTAIAAEHAALLQRLQAAVSAAHTAREHLAQAEHASAVAADELARQQAAADRGGLQVRQLADRAVVAARLDAQTQREIAGAAPERRIEAAIRGLTQRLDALPGRLARHLGNEAVIGRDGRVQSVPVLRLGEARAVALGEGGHRGLLERAADGSSWLVAGPPLPAMSASAVPLDVAGTAAHQSAARQRSLGEWLAAGRAFIWPIIAAFLLGLGIVVARAIVLLRSRSEASHLTTVAELLARDERSGALALVASGGTPLDRVMRAGLDAVGQPREVREAAVEQALLVETGRLGRGLTMIAVLAGVAPLLGLLGTVTGMIDMFSVIAAQGGGNAKGLSGGISEALICTQAGMMAAIPLLLAHAWLSRLAERRSHLLEEAACGILGLTERGA